MNRKSLPNYLLNLYELGDAFEDVFKSNKRLDSGSQRAKGFNIKSLDYGVQKVDWITPYDMYITNIAFTQSKIRNMGYKDCVNIYLNGEVFYEGIYLKETEQNKPFKTRQIIPKGSVISVEYVNNTGIEKDFNIDIYHVYGELEFEHPTIPPPPIEDVDIIIRCYDVDGNLKIYTETHTYNPSTMSSVSVSPPNIDNYITNDSDIEVEIYPYMESPIYVDFYYEKEILFNGHGFDWIVELYWEGHTQTDLDLYCFLVDENNELIENTGAIRSFVYHGRPYYNDNKGGEMWLDYDQTDHSGVNDREDKPEIASINGINYGYIRLTVRVFNLVQPLSEIVEIKIYKNEGNEKVLQQTISRSANLFNSQHAVVEFGKFALYDD